MKNFIFISPNFPENYYLFCKHLKENGLNVLGVGDCPYDELKPELRESLNEYYKVSSLENYPEVYEAVRFFQSKYGKIDWLESNNEYWLERDAMLRSDFDINSGFKVEDLASFKNKSNMKQFYHNAGIKTARYHLVYDYEECVNFLNEVGYPVIVKPDNGVGASDTYKLNNLDEFNYFYATKDPSVIFIMEEFIFARVDSYDAIIDSQGNPIFESGTVSPVNIMDIVNNDDNALYHIDKNIPDDLRQAGRATVKSFNVRNRFVHFEFFRLTEDQYIGKEGEVVALEVNMRPCGGCTPDMMNYAYATDVYKIYADMIAFDHSDLPHGEHKYCAFAGRRDGKSFEISYDDLYYKYKDNIVTYERVPDALASTMGNFMYLATFDTEEEMNEFYNDSIK